MKFSPKQRRVWRLTAWLNGRRNEGLGLADSLHGLLDLLTGSIGLQSRAQVQSGRQRIQPATILNRLDSGSTKFFLWRRRAGLLTLGPWTAWASGSLQKEPEEQQWKEFKNRDLQVQHAENVSQNRCPPGGSCWVPVCPWQQSAPYLELQGLQMASLPSDGTVIKGEFKRGKPLKLTIIVIKVLDSQLPMD